MNLNINMYIPIALIVISNVFYAICAKSAPNSVNPLASLTITYIVGAICSCVLFYATNPSGNLFKEYRGLNWSSFILGIAIVGLEAGSILMYKAGWNVNTGMLVHSSILAVILIFVGYLLYHEAITPSKIAGIIICMIGLFFINR